MSSLARFTSGSAEQIAQRIAEKTLQRVSRSSKSLSNLGTQFIQKSYETDFSKAPIDTGLSQSLSGVQSLEVRGLNIFINLVIATDYSIYFRKGTGSNKRYGPRDPLEKTKTRIVDGVLKYIRDVS